MVKVLKLVTPHQVKRAKRNNQLLLCEAPNQERVKPSLFVEIRYTTFFFIITCSLVRTDVWFKSFVKKALYLESDGLDGDFSWELNGDPLEQIRVEKTLGSPSRRIRLQKCLMNDTIGIVFRFIVRQISLEGPILRTKKKE